jgi:hypothetical protein
MVGKLIPRHLSTGNCPMPPGFDLSSPTLQHTKNISQKPSGKGTSSASGQSDLNLEMGSKHSNSQASVAELKARFGATTPPLKSHKGKTGSLQTTPEQQGMWNSQTFVGQMGRMRKCRLYVRQTFLRKS